MLLMLSTSTGTCRHSRGGLIKDVCRKLQEHYWTACGTLFFVRGRKEKSKEITVMMMKMKNGGSAVD